LANAAKEQEMGMSRIKARALAMLAIGIIGTVLFGSPVYASAATSTISTTCDKACVDDGNRRLAIVDAARYEYAQGVTEANQKCNKYLKTGEGNCRTTPWCGAFTRYIWEHNYAKSYVPPNNPLWATNWGASNNTSWFKLRGSGKGGSPRPGDVVVYGPPGADGHVAIVVAVHANGNIDTIGGNVSNKVTLRTNIDPRYDTSGASQHIWGYRKP
jgi:hypothetical protein